MNPKSGNRFSGQDHAQAKSVADGGDPRFKNSEETMTCDILSVRDARTSRPAITPLFSMKRAAARLRRVWRGYWDRQARRAIAVMLHALDDRTLADLGTNRDAVEPLAGRPLSLPGPFTASPQ